MRRLATVSRRARAIIRSTVQIRLNGELVDIAGPMTVSALLAHYAIDPRRVAVEHNLVVVKRAAYDETLVKEDDEVEVVNFVGGG